MNVTACDACLIEKKITLATRRIGFRHGASANVCERHRESVKRLDAVQLYELRANAGRSHSTMLDAAMPPRRKN